MSSQNESEAGVAAPANAEKAGIKKVSLTKVLPSDRLALDRQIAALRAFGAVFESNEGKPVTNQQAGDVAKMAAATIVVTNAYFTDVGLLTRSGDGFTVAPEVVAFMAAEHGLSPESAPEKLRPLLERNWVSQLLVPRLKVNPMDVESARKVIGEACNASPVHIPRLDILIEFFAYVGIFKKDGNQIRSSGANRVEAPVPPKANDGGHHSSGNGNGGGSSQENTEGLETYTLTLDPKQNRRVIIKAPPTVTEAELKRIQQWLSFQLIVAGAESV
jgi:hypothetical protein